MAQPGATKRSSASGRPKGTRNAVWPVTPRDTIPKRGQPWPRGVACEACHGPLAEGHPDTAIMTLPQDSETCQPCHGNTYQEWQAGTHDQHGIQCFYCHAPHDQALRVQPEGRLCSACHSQRMEELSNATHGVRGLDYTTGHMPGRQAVLGGVGSSGVPAHDLSLGVGTCTECHRGDVHTGHGLATLEAQLDRLQNVGVVLPEEQGPSLSEQVDILEQEVQPCALPPSSRWVPALGLEGSWGW